MVIVYVRELLIAGLSYVFFLSHLYFLGEIYHKKSKGSYFLKKTFLIVIVTL